MTDDHRTVARSGGDDAVAGERDPEDDPACEAADEPDGTTDDPVSEDAGEPNLTTDARPNRTSRRNRSRADRPPRSRRRPPDEPPPGRDPLPRPAPLRRGSDGRVGDRSRDRSAPGDCTDTADGESVVPRSVLELLRLARVVGETALALARLLRHL